MSIIVLPVFHWIVDKTHINVDGMNVWNTILDPDGDVIQFGVVQCLHGLLCLLSRVVLHQAPVLQHSVLLRDLTKQYNELTSSHR